MVDEKIIAWMLKGSSEINDVYRLMDQSLLRSILLPDYKVISDYIHKYYSKHRVPPSVSVLESIMIDGGDEPDDLDFIENETCDDNEIGYYLDKARERFNKYILSSLSEKISDDYDDVVEINDEVSKILSITKKLYRIDIFSEGNFKESADQRLDSYEYTEKNPDEVMGVLSGFKELDEYTWGIKNSEMMVIAGGSSSGKSLLMMNMAINSWLGKNKVGQNIDESSGANVVFFSLEMSKDQLEQRIDANLADIRHRALTRGQLTDEERLRWKDSLSFQKKYGKYFYIVDMPRGSTVSEIKSKYEAICGMFEPDAVYVDYLQLLSPSAGSNISDWESVGKVSEELHEFCRKYNKPVITAAQRKARQKTKGTKAFKDTIDLEDIGRSKMIGDNSNIVLLIEYREDEHLREDMPVHIVKNRDGAKGCVFLKKEFAQSKVTDLPDGWAQDFGEENEI